MTEFEGVDLRRATFWGVDLRDATMRDVDLSGTRIDQCRLVDVVIDGEIDRIVINGVDVTEHVNSHDPWFALRSRVRPTDLSVAHESWPLYVAAWETLIDRVVHHGSDVADTSVNGEWSVTQTLQHLVFATDKWFTGPIVGGDFTPIGKPNSGSIDFDWPGVVRDATATFDEAVAAWRQVGGRVSAYLSESDRSASDTVVEVLENGPHAIRDCVGVVFEEHFQHLRYVTRDLQQLDDQVEDQLDHQLERRNQPTTGTP